MKTMMEAFTVLKEMQEKGGHSVELIADAVDIVVGETAEGYSTDASDFAALRQYDLGPWDEYMNTVLLAVMRERVRTGSIQVSGNPKWNLLDVGAGHGRDYVRFSKELDIRPIALDNSIGFITLLQDMANQMGLSPETVVQADMRKMPAIEESSVHCVRNHATLHHLPLLSCGLGVDEALEESFRVLTPGGVLYLLVKSGHGLELIDTGEGLGSRFYQLFDRESTRAALERNGFVDIHMEEREELRGDSVVPWLFVLAVTSKQVA